MLLLDLNPVVYLVYFFELNLHYISTFSGLPSLFSISISATLASLLINSFFYAFDTRYHSNIDRSNLDDGEPEIFIRFFSSFFLSRTNFVWSIFDIALL